MAVETSVARSCELHERDAWLACVEACAAVDGNALGAELAWAGKTAVPVVAAVDFALFNRIIGLGVDSPVPDGTVEAIRSLYEARGQSNWTISVSPLAQPPDLHVRLQRLGMRHKSDVAKMVRRPQAALPVRTDLRIDAVGVERADQVASAAFGVAESFLTWFRGTFGRPGCHHYMAFDGDEAVATGALYAEGGLAWLTFGATLPSHRNRGCQSALMARRISDAAQLGCRFVHTETGVETAARPNPSYRNMVRSGFQLAYVRADYVAQ